MFEKHATTGPRQMPGRTRQRGTLLRWFLSAAAKIHRLRQPPSGRLVTERTGSRARRPTSPTARSNAAGVTCIPNERPFCIAGCLGIEGKPELIHVSYTQGVG